ncbi:MAG: SAM hydroxide adenosyltransferase, partial [Ferruginibacter sp.]
TLYCASVFAEAFRDIAAGKKLEDIGDAEISIKVKNPLKPMLSSDWIEGQIIFIDNFENVVVNIHRDDFEEQRKGRRFSIVFKRDETIDKISETYADVAEGKELAHFNSSGYLEISINKGNAAGLFGLQGFSETLQISTHQNRLFYQTVKIFFENN